MIVGLGATPEEMGLEVCNQTNVNDQYACSQRNMKKMAEYYCARGSVGDCQALGMEVPGAPLPLYDNGGSAVYNNIVPDPTVTYLTPSVANQVPDYVPITIPASLPPIAPVTNNQTTNNVVNTQIPTNTVTPVPVLKLFNKTTGLEATQNGSFKVGDMYRIVGSGLPPNSPIYGSAYQNNVSLGTNTWYTDGSGNFLLEGGLDQSTIGTWIEQWNIGNKTFNMSFSVSGVVNNTSTPANPINGQNNAVTQTQTNTTTNTTNSTTNNPTTQTQSTPNSLDEVTSGVSALFTPSQWTDIMNAGSTMEKVGLLAVPALLLLVVMGGRR